MSKLKKIQELISRRITLLGAGPMSKFSVDAIIELSNFYNLPIAMIPSRRQIECKELGGLCRKLVNRRICAICKV